MVDGRLMDGQAPGHVEKVPRIGSEFRQRRHLLGTVHRRLAGTDLPEVVDEQVAHERGQVGSEARLRGIVARRAEDSDQFHEDLLDEVVLLVLGRAVQADERAHGRQIAFEEVRPDGRVIAGLQVGDLPQKGPGRFWE